MALKEILGSLSDDQKLAVTAGRNAVVAAGAGSGKTKTLAARYAWLVTEKGLAVDEILTLTFTNKAAAEMYSRIYDTLLTQTPENGSAREAIRSFHKARISTLDSFCLGIVRAAARRYGISPDFIIDDAAVRRIAAESALPFVLENRENSALRILLANKKIQNIADGLFASAVLRHGCVSCPPDFDAFLRSQEEELKQKWREKTGKAAECLACIAGEMSEIGESPSRIFHDINAALPRPAPEIPGLSPFFDAQAPRDEREAARRSFREYFECLYSLKGVSLKSGGKDFAVIKETLKSLRELYGELEALANSILQKDITDGVFPFLKNFFAAFDVKKRQAGILGFNDISRLAVDALSRHPDIRKAYKDGIKAIMIDEFQDNNSLQRDLVFLLAEKPERMEKGVPRREDLEDGKMFFVGDEKQSIYRFRGADVSVFRGLAKTLADGGEASLNLKNNYRSNPRLVDAFNLIFGGLLPEEPPETRKTSPAVFLSAGETIPDFEAAYNRMYSPAGLPADGKAAVHFCFLDKGRLPEDMPARIPPHELEAIFIARRIREMVEEGFPVARRKDDSLIYSPCVWADFAILQRTYTRQAALEKYFKEAGIPFTADKPAGLFTDAPGGDVYMLLRLIAYPQDRLAYAAVLRSPFARLGDETLSACLLETLPEAGAAPEEAARGPFGEETENLLSPGERILYREAARRYTRLAEAAKVLSVSELVTRLWYDEGYRYETLWSESAQVYTEFFDVLFKIAQDIDRRGQTLPDFVDFLQALIAHEERLDDLDIPVEGGEGVRLMSIHKSKGLEFPIVFVYAGAQPGRVNADSEPIYFHEKWGVSLNLPCAEELPEKGGNYFYISQKEEERQKEAAELRRLLYVAMTRAETCLYFTAALPAMTQEEKKAADPDEACTAEFIRKRLRALSEKKAGQNPEEVSYSNFLALLVPALAAADGSPLFTVEAIPVLTRSGLREAAARSKQKTALPPRGRTGSSMRKKAAAAAAGYETAKEITPSFSLPAGIPASSLRAADSKKTGQPAATKKDSLDAILEKTKLDAADFGTIVHGFLEALLNGRRGLVPPRILARLENSEDAEAVRAAAEKMAGGFLDSDLGKKSMASPYREAEFAVLSRVTLPPLKGRPGGPEETVFVTGKIDLLFEAEGQTHIVDFKTDSEEDPGRHTGQLAMYSRAAADIFGKPVRAWLFYLRTGRARELTGDIEKISIEDIAAAYVRENSPPPAI